MALPANTIEYYVTERDAARARGDHNQAAAIDADLRRWGYVDAPAKPRAKPASNGRSAPKRKPRARCEHNRIPERCEDCRAAEIEETRGGRRRAAA